ncbi:hypothetical protein BU14_0177s0009 [Porphyra umbilicalis]|uniref:Vacuolar protein sorting-associated protein 45 n=1 Tax=Porphyra umbilicalis TaxID=2786 RepID=A0A1X6P796_PORUM|nr:hypothetical protein BU14_0177s0009 [Porphyra umbilicalis]|eukprot:OSX76728.1 hypothetical protein BU14_0177s0009 [Porphyra umbilicalis]
MRPSRLRRVRVRRRGTVRQPAPGGPARRRPVGARRRADHGRPWRGHVDYPRPRVGGAGPQSAPRRWRNDGYRVAGHVPVHPPPPRGLPRGECGQHAAPLGRRGGRADRRPPPRPPPTPPMKYLRALAFLRPTAANILHLRSELSAPRFSSYDILFSNVLSRTLLEDLASSDVHSLIASVSESYADVYPVGKSLFTLGVSPCVDVARRAGAGATAAAAVNPFNRTVDGVVAALASLNLRPGAIRYDGGSGLARALAQRVSVRLDAEGDIFSARRGGARGGASGRCGLLLIVDRREDPVTPLLSQWTYQAMVHELLGLHKGRVDLSTAPGVRDDARQVVLNGVDDDFYRGHMYKNFGDLGAGLAALVADFQSQSASTTSTARVESIEQMRAFVDAYPAFRSASAHVSKHVTLMAELSRLVEARALLTLSALEQDLACREAEAEHKKKVAEAVRDPALRVADRLRLLLLYALRHETSPSAGVGALADALASATGTVEGGRAVQSALRGLRAYAGARRRRGDVFNNRTFLALAKSTVKRGLGGVENVYTQHEPLLARTLESLFRGRLSADAFPVVGEEDGGLSGDSAAAAAAAAATAPASSRGRSSSLSLGEPRTRKPAAWRRSMGRSTRPRRRRGAPPRGRPPPRGRQGGRWSLVAARCTTLTRSWPRWRAWWRPRGGRSADPSSWVGVRWVWVGGRGGTAVEVKCTSPPCLFLGGGRYVAWRCCWCGSCGPNRGH